MATKSTLISRTRSSLLDPSGIRYTDAEIEAALLSEARSLFASEDVPSDMIGSVLVEADAVDIASDGTFKKPDNSLRICVGYIGPTRVTRVIMRKGISRPSDHTSMATVGDPAIFEEATKTYLLPPGEFSGKRMSILYVPETIDIENIPAAFEDCICYGAASRLFADKHETKSSEINFQRALSHLNRVIGKTK